jgi:hypothetical protein
MDTNNIIILKNMLVKRLIIITEQMDTLTLYLANNTECVNFNIEIIRGEKIKIYELLCKERNENIEALTKINSIYE